MTNVGCGGRRKRLVAACGLRGGVRQWPAEEVVTDMPWRRAMSGECFRESDLRISFN